MMQEVYAMVHSDKRSGAQNPVVCTLMQKLSGNNDYELITPAGVHCHGIYNPFSGLYYADDLYAVID